MKKIILLMLAGFLLGSCNNGKDSSNTDFAEHEHHVTTADHYEMVELNDGVRWLVNDEMKPYVMQGESRVKSFIENKETDYKALAEDLTEQNNLLIESCTMDGKSHDELHKWLHPHLELVAALKEADQKKGESLVREIRDSYDRYHQYFQ